MGPFLYLSPSLSSLSSPLSLSVIATFPFLSSLPVFSRSSSLSLSPIACLCPGLFVAGSLVIYSSLSLV